MHEMGIVLSMIDTASRLAKQYQVSKLCSVTIEVGELSSALPRYLMELWPMGAKGTVCEGSELIINEEQGIARCSGCAKEYPVMDNLKNDYPVCPYCGNDHYTIVAGSEILITELGVMDE